MCLPGTAEIVRERVEAEGTPKVDRRTALLGAAGAALAASFPASALANGGRRRKGRFCDLTHTFREGFPVFVTGEEPERETIADYATSGFYAQRWTFGEHSGTHMDVPGHFHPGGRLSPDIELRELIVPIVVIDIRRRAATDPNAMVELDDIKSFERRHGKIPRGALVAADSGWAEKVDDPDAFKGGPAFPNYNFPGWGLEAAMFLAEKRDITGHRDRHPQPRSGELSHLPRACHLPGDRPLRDREPHRSRLHPAERRDGLRRAYPLGGRLRRPVQGDRPPGSRVAK